MINDCFVAGKLVDNRRHLEAACLLTDYANVCTHCVFLVLFLVYCILELIIFVFICAAVIAESSSWYQCIIYINFMLSCSAPQIRALCTTLRALQITFE